MILVIKGWQAGQHLVQQDAQAVYIEAAIMAFSVREHFRAQVLWRPAKRIRSFILRYDLSETKVCDSDMAIHIY